MNVRKGKPSRFIAERVEQLKAALHAYIAALPLDEQEALPIYVRIALRAYVTARAVEKAGCP